MNLECVKENHLISQLAFSHYSDRYDLIKRLFEISNLADCLSKGSRYESYHSYELIFISMLRKFGLIPQ